MTASARTAHTARVARVARPARRARPAAAGAVLACVAALAAACGSSTPAATPTKTVTVSPATGKTATSSTAAATTSSAPAAPAGPAPCPTRSLGLKLGLSQGTAGSVYQVLDFTNISNVSCTLYGYPGVSLAGGHPVKQVGLAADENPNPPRKLVTLAPGAVANALLRIVDALNYPTAKCGPVTTKWLQIYPPNQTTPVFLSYTTKACSKRVKFLTVSVVQPGSGGQ
jgi:hypothetical protein